jgi:hypothetical protein
MEGPAPCGARDWVIGVGVGIGIGVEFPLVLSIPTPTPMVSSPRKERVVFAPKKPYSIERFINTRKRYGPRKFSPGF